MSEDPSPRRSQKLRSGIVAAVVFLLAGGGALLALRGWSGALEEGWAEKDERLPVGTPRLLIEKLLGPPSRTLETPAQARDAGDWSYVIETRGDCGAPPDGFEAFAAGQIAQGRVLLDYRIGFPVSRHYLYALDPDGRLICRIIGGS